MFALLLLASHVSAEWVEIAQQQHRQETPQRFTLIYNATTEANKIYANYSATKRPWHTRGLPRIPNFGSVKRVQLQTKEKDVFSVGVLSQSIRAKQKTLENREYESLSPVRAPNVTTKQNTKTVNANYMKHNFENINQTNIRFHNPSRNFGLETEKTYFENHDIFKDNMQTIEKNKFQEYNLTDDDEHNTKMNYKMLEINPNVKRERNESDIGITQEVYVIKDYKGDTRQYLKESRNKTSNNPSGTTNNIDETASPTNKNFYEDGSTLPKDFSPKPNVQNISEYNSQKHANKINVIENPTKFFQTKLVQKCIKDSLKNCSDLNQSGFKDAEHVNLDDNTKKNPIEVIWKLMKVVTDNISRNTRRSFKSKIRYLENLRNNIVANIEEQVEQAWPDEEETGPRERRKRAARGHVEFPSSESALMTISFLTFAVFLIKLVLQVIHTYKNKTMMVTPAVVAAVGRVSAAVGRNAQSLNPSTPY